MDLKTLIEAEELNLTKLKQLVQTSLKEEELISEKLIELESDTELSLGQRMADKIAVFGGSWTFIISFFTFLVIWIVINVALIRTNPFDPYPFILLNLILSCIAALQAPVIMMSQNRLDYKDRVRARSDYMVNLKAEIEVRGLHSKVDLLIAEQMRQMFNIQKIQLESLESIEKKLDATIK